MGKRNLPRASQRLLIAREENKNLGAYKISGFSQFDLADLAMSLKVPSDRYVLFR